MIVCETRIRVGEAVAADAEAVVGLLVQLHPRYRGDARVAKDVIEDASKDEKRNILVAELAGRVVGTVDVIIVPNLSHDGRPWAIVENLVVDEQARGGGVGTALVRRVIELASSSRAYMIQLLSLSHRLEAHAFYRRLGFDGVAVGFRVYLDGHRPTAETD